MSDTPRTDLLIDRLCPFLEGRATLALEDHARKLERENATLTAEVERKQAALEEKQYIPLALQEVLYETIKHYANRCTYQAPRIGGVAEGCPRGREPTVEELTQPAIDVLTKWDAARRAVLPVGGAG